MIGGRFRKIKKSVFLRNRDTLIIDYEELNGKKRYLTTSFLPQCNKMAYPYCNFAPLIHFSNQNN